MGRGRGDRGGLVTIGECRGVAPSHGLICTKRVHLGFSKVAFIEGCGWWLNFGSSSIHNAFQLAKLNLGC